VKVYVGDILTETGGHVHRDMHSDIAPLCIDGEEIAFPAGIELSIDVYNTGKLFHLQVAGRTIAHAHCHRCLEPAFVPLDLEYTEEYTRKPGGSKPADRRGETEEKDHPHSEDETSEFSGNEIDIRQSVKEQLLLTLPMKILCRSDCLGLCPVCGARLNEGECGCTREVPDPRLASLLDFRRALSDCDTPQDQEE